MPSIDSRANLMVPSPTSIIGAGKKRQSVAQKRTAVATSDDSNLMQKAQKQEKN